MPYSKTKGWPKMLGTVSHHNHLNSCAVMNPQQEPAIHNPLAAVPVGISATPRFSKEQNSKGSHLQQKELLSMLSKGSGVMIKSSFIIFTMTFFSGEQFTGTNTWNYLPAFLFQTHLFVSRFVEHSSSGAADHMGVRLHRYWRRVSSSSTYTSSSCVREWVHPKPQARGALKSVQM